MASDLQAELDELCKESPAWWFRIGSCDGVPLVARTRRLHLGDPSGGPGGGRGYRDRGP
jgi:hypothetical protein